MPDDFEGERPAWLPDNFRSPEAVVESYREAQRKITEQGNLIAQQNETIQMYEIAWAEYQTALAAQPVYEPPPVYEAPPVQSPPAYIEPHAALMPPQAPTIAQPQATREEIIAEYERTREMKLAAQGLRGAGGRPAPEDDDVAAWGRIRDAGKNSSYSELMSRRQ